MSISRLLVCAREAAHVACARDAACLSGRATRLPSAFGLPCMPGKQKLCSLHSAHTAMEKPCVTMLATQ